MHLIHDELYIFDASRAHAYNVQYIFNLYMDYEVDESTHENDWMRLTDREERI